MPEPKTQKTPVTGTAEPEGKPEPAGTNTAYGPLNLRGLARTRDLGLALAKGLPARAIVLLSGEMGAGKTTLVKALCEGLGIDPRIVISPTYTLVNVYPGTPNVYHVDLFRIEHPEALLELDRDDWINPAGPTLVEWPGMAKPLLNGEVTLELELRPLPEQGADAREVRVWADPAYHGEVLDLLANFPAD